MQITQITPQTNDKNRVNIYVDGKYRLSLDVFQIVDLGIKINNQYDLSQIEYFMQESQFGKIYTRALEYCLSRPRSSKEVKTYLYKKTIHKIDKKGQKIPGVSKYITERVYDRLLEKKYIDDEKFAQFWIENRFVKKGISSLRLKNELLTKGVSNDIIDNLIVESDRNDINEIKKIINKKRAHYDDDKKLINYLMRLGFRYDDIKESI